ncbi:hypothetical protein [Sinorhizobium sp. BG8]|uniref:hypothetical protein n=1 Tax=Sinorhizobium sp. BG8 TaxID=2613773 RepID=UPI00193CA724|nr:hypothetical protein [Sinorhizobium sp. BG8]QRM55148.1 hypothetical protein F3Y30_11840 [Sinorhizobium sp. BG8]
MEKVTVKLSRSYQGHDGTFDSVTLREPTYKEIFIDGLGEPQQWQPAPDGSNVLITLPDVVDDYVRKLAVTPTADNLSTLGVRDALAVGRAVLSFFQELPARETPRTGSSSASDGTQVASS